MGPTWTRFETSKRKTYSEKSSYSSSRSSGFSHSSGSIFRDTKCPKCGGGHLDCHDDFKFRGMVLFTPIIEPVKDYKCDDCGHKYTKSDCFIATTVYGNVNAPELDVLRYIRDEHLMKNPVGKLGVKLYYNGVGKTLANIIKQHAPFTIPTIKKGLDFLVDKYSKRI